MNEKSFKKSINTQSIYTMKQTKNTKIDLVKGYIEKYIELGIKNNCGYSKKFIAKVIAAEHPSLFKDVEAVRTYIRVITQSKGKGDYEQSNFNW